MIALQGCELTHISFNYYGYVNFPLVVQKTVVKISQKDVLENKEAIKSYFA